MEDDVVCQKLLKPRLEKCVGIFCFIYAVWCDEVLDYCESSTCAVSPKIFSICTIRESI